MTLGRWVAGLSCALAVACVMTPATAEPRVPAASEVEGRVIELQGGEFVLDLGTATGLREGQRVPIWRPVVVRHPVTKRLLSDRFQIGELELVQVRPNMTLARPVEGLSREVEVGDVILLDPPRVNPAPAPSPPIAAGAPPATTAHGPPVDRYAEAIGALLVSLRGAPPEARARAYDDFAAADPRSPYAVALRQEAMALRRPAPAPRPRVPMALRAPRIDEVRWGEPVDVALEITMAAGAVLHVRTVDDPSFVSLPMRPASGRYYAATIPGAQVNGALLEFFVEAVDDDGRAIEVLGGPEDPLRAVVRPAPEAPPPPDHLVTARIWTDYADYNRLRGDDYAWQTEGEFGLRLGDEGVRAVRSGFGVYRGRGGSVEDLDDRGLAPRSIGLTYGYLEGELAPTTSFAILPRVVLGLGDDGVAGGAQLLFRLGSDRETNLLFGGEALGTVGVRGIAQIELAVFERFPILFRTEVSNQPAGASPSASDAGPDPDPRSLEGSDIGARGIAEVGFRATDALVLRLRGSFQGRTIEHAGPGFGGGVSYSW